MKLEKLYLVIMMLSIWLLSTDSLQSQSPQVLRYQTVIYDNSGDPVVNSPVSVRIQILSGSANGSVAFSESHTISTNSNGLITIKIAYGTLISGSFASLDWASNQFWLRVEADLSAGSNYSLYSNNQILSVPYALYAKTVANASGKTYSLGDVKDGGIVFWLDETRQHGLICALSDQSAGCPWISNPSFLYLTLATGDGVFSGAMNTTIIKIVEGFGAGINYAARLAHEYHNSYQGKEYGGWYLPSKHELSLMLAKKGLINSIASNNGGTALTDAGYWSSTEYDISRAYFLDFSTGSSGFDSKLNSYRVRAIKSF